MAVVIYGHDVRIVSDPVLLGGVPVVIDRTPQTGAGDVPRRGVLAGSGVLRCDKLAIDTSARKVTYASIPVPLRRREYALLTYLARDPDRIWTRHELLRDAWGYRSHGTTRTLDSHASRLRCKLAAAGAIGWIVAAWGVGYRLAP